MSEQPCPGNCNSRHWKAVKDYGSALAWYDPLDPDTSRPEPPGESLVRSWGDPWCPSCTAEIRLRLAQLDDLAAILSAAADGYETSPRTERVGGSSEPRSPSQAADELADMSGILAAWEGTYRELRGWPSPAPRGDDAGKLTTCIAWLARHLDGILASDFAREFGTEVLDWRRAIANRAKAGTRTLRMPLRCPRCRLLSLTWEEGSDEVKCGDDICGQILTRAQYEALVETTAASISAGEYAPEEAGAA
jgi:ribosomal protein S27E